jgi:DNA-binding NtrC family response regulator
MKKIMVVDDEKDIRDSVKTILFKNGYSVVTAVSADDALKKISIGKKPDLVLMDIMMPGTPVKKIVPKLGVKVVYLSVVKISEVEKGDLISKNVLGFIEKPFNVRYLVKSVKKYLE